MKPNQSIWMPSDMRLADQEVAPERADWFARTRLNVIDWYPQTALNLVCVLILLIAGHREIGITLSSLVAGLCLMPMMGVHLLYWRARKTSPVDHVRV